MNKEVQNMLNFMPPKIRRAFLFNLNKQEKLDEVLQYGHRSISMLINYVYWEDTSQGDTFWRQASVKLSARYEAYKRSREVV